ncbi:MAG: DUF4382 domain-containing protein [Burkholderiales bacterium]
MALLLSAFLAGCGGGGDSGEAGGGGSGTLGVSLTDAPACGFDAVNVTVTQVRVHRSDAASDGDGGWSEITLSPARKINLLNLTNGELDYLGETALPAGHYTQLRLMLAANTGSSAVSNSVVLSSGPRTEIALKTPSAVQSGLKVVHGFDVAAGQRVDLVLDFDACKSVVALGNGGFLLKPVIKVIPTVLNGINGFVAQSLLGRNVMVSAQMDGTVVRSTSPDMTTGAFFLARLDPGNYAVVITADDSATAVIDAVPVPTSTSVVEISTNAAPFILPPSAARTISGTATLSPASTTDEAVSVAAKQTVGSGPAVTATVKTQSAELLSGDYTLTLPAGAPQFGRYVIGGTLPIPLVGQSAAGQYAVEASATGYQTQSFTKNISTANATQHFVLSP